MGRGRVLRAGAALVALTAAAVACSSDDGTTATTDTTAPASTTTSAAPPTSAPPTTPSSGTQSTTTTEAPAGVELRFDGVGPVDVGTPADDAVDALTDALGPPTEVRDWTQPSCELAGPDGPGASSVVWDGLLVVFRGDAEADATLAGWTYQGGPVGDVGVLALPSGITIGDPGSNLSSAYGSAATFQAFEMFDPHWEVVQGSAVLWATVGTDAPGADITRMDLDPQLCE